MADISKISPDNGTTIYNLKDIEARKRVPEVLLKDTVGWSGKNKLINHFNGGTYNGLTFVVNDDGSISISGTANANTYISLHNRNTDPVELEQGDYILSGCPEGGSENTYQLFYIEYDSNGQEVPPYRNDYGTGVSFQRTSNNQYNITILIKSGQNMSGKTFYPMLRKANISDSTYEPYHISVEEVVGDITVLGACNLLNLNKDNLRSVSANGYDLTANGIRVYNTQESGSYRFAAFWLKHLPKNTNIELRFRVNISSGKGRILISDRTDPVVTVYERDFPENGEFTIRFNTSNYELLSINFYSSVEAAAGDVTYSYTILGIDSLISDSDNLENIYVPYAMTNREITEELTEVIDGSSGITSTGTLDNDYLILKRIGQEVFCQLRVNGTFATGATLAVLPEGFRPKKRITAAGNISTKGLVYVDINEYGIINCGGQAVSNENFILLYTSWRID